MKITLYFILTNLLFVSCHSTRQKSSDPYRAIKKNLLYEDSAANVYLRVQEQWMGTDSVYYSYYKEVGFNDSIFPVKKVVDVPTFDYYKKSRFFFKDKNHIFVFQGIPTTFPPFCVLNLDSSKTTLLGDRYIKDDKNVYWLSRKIENAESKTFRVYAEDKPLEIAFDKNSIYKEGKKLSLEDSIYFPKMIKDSILSYYFSK